jgi:[ribosomal protein S5]-alanine N-acetyltransferase
LITGIDHVQVAAPAGCEGEARRFYGGLLGLEEIEKPAALRAKGGVWFRCGAQQLHVGVADTFAPAEKAHPALAVPAPRLQELAGRLIAAGVALRWDQEIVELRRFYTMDPWGNRLELVEREAARAPLVYPDPELSDGEVRLRRWQPKDLECVRQAATDPRIPLFTSVPEVFSAEAALAFIERQWRRLEDGAGISMAIAQASTDLAVGSIWVGFRAHHGVVALGYWVVPDARGRGVGGRAARLAGDWVLGYEGIARVEALVQPENVPSQRLLVSAGFVCEGVLRSLLSFGSSRSDAVVYSRVAATSGAGAPGNR